MVIFADKDMSVSLDAVHKKIREINDSHKEEVQKVTDEYVDFVNETKRLFSPTGRAHIFGRTWYGVGKPTGKDLNGIELYTGDEVEVHGGRLGIITIDSNDNVIIRTNAESYVFNSITKQRIKINRHMHTYKDSDEVAKGRNGGEGFIIELNGGN